MNQLAVFSPTASPRQVANNIYRVFMYSGMRKYMYFAIFCILGARELVSIETEIEIPTSESISMHFAETARAALAIILSAFSYGYLIFNN